MHCTVLDNLFRSELLYHRIATGHLLLWIGEQEAKLLISQLTDEILNFREEGTVRQLRSGLRVFL